MIVLLTWLNAPVFANQTEPTNCAQALATGRLPWRALRLIRELGLAHVQVAHQLGASDLGAPRTLVSFEEPTETFTAWVEISHPAELKHYVRVILNPDFRVVLAHAKGHPGNEAAQIFADWDKFERRAVAAAGPLKRRMRLALLFMNNVGPIATLELEPGPQFAPETLAVNLSEAPLNPPTLVPIQLPPSLRVNVDVVANAFLTSIDPRLTHAPATQVLRAEVGPGRAAQVLVKAEHETFWVVADANGALMVDRGHFPAEILDVQALTNAMSDYLHAHRRGSTVTKVVLVREAGTIKAFVHLFEGIATNRATFELRPPEGLSHERVQIVEITGLP